MVNSRAKGAAGEREAAKWLKLKFKLEYEPKRNLEQVRSGGYDLTGFHPFALEIKRCQTISKREWWMQVRSATLEGEIAVVMFRQNNTKWRFLVPAEFIGIPTGFIQLEEREFVLWATNILKEISHD